MSQPPGRRRPRGMTALAFSRTGTGDPLVLLHALGSSRAAWEPVVPALAERFDVVAVDLPGFGVTLIAPAGLWRDRTPLYCRVSLRATRWLCRHAAGLLDHLVTGRRGRALVLGQVVGRPTRMTSGQARAAI